ncbi:MAG: PQQ-like beta-propeller repeat protein, partial [Actinomycetota bacterium]|nr:PQQ-like beta-propeller repeat protein [Actinomycetota bacterium]
MRRIAALLVVLAALAPLPAAQAADETTQYLANVGHTNSVPDSPLQPPLKLRWRADLGHVASNVLVTGGRVFYVREPGTGTQLTALGTADGSQLWSQPVTGGATLAADGGRLFVVGDSSDDYPYSVLVRALDPATGNQLWSRTIESEYGAGSHPTAANGQLFLLAASGGTSLYGLRQSDGQNLWPPKGLVSGDGSAPALDGDSVYVSLPAHRTYAFRRSDGTERWQSKGCCTGGGGLTPVLNDGRLYGYDGLIHQTSDGLIVGEWTSLPVWSGDVGVVREDTTLRGIGPDYGTTRWTATLPSSYSGYSFPFIAGQHVYTGTQDELRANRLGDGGEAWCVRPELPAGTDYS